MEISAYNFPASSPRPCSGRASPTKPAASPSSCCCSPSSSPSSLTAVYSPRAVLRSSNSSKSNPGNCPFKTVTGGFGDLKSGSTKPAAAAFDSGKPAACGRYTRWRPSAIPVYSYAGFSTVAADPWDAVDQAAAAPSDKYQYSAAGSNYSSGTTTTVQNEVSFPANWGPGTSYYTILGVSASASPREIRLAYRRLALQYHPDVCPLHQLETSTKVFAQINDAYATLADPQKRASYDLKLSPSGFTVAAAAAGSGSPVCSSPSPRAYTHASTGRVYPSMNSFYREWRSKQHSSV